MATQRKYLPGLISALSLALSPMSLFAADLDAQKALYAKQCKKCHASDGSGKKENGAWLPVVKTLKLEKPEVLDILRPEVRKAADEELLKALREGKNKKKPLKDKLTEDEMKSMVKYVRHLQSQKK